MLVIKATELLLMNCCCIKLLLEIKILLILTPFNNKFELSFNSPIIDTLPTFDTLSQFKYISVKLKLLFMAAIIAFELLVPITILFKLLLEAPKEAAIQLLLDI